MKKAITAVLMAALFTGLAAHPAINGWERFELKGRVKTATFWADSSARYHFDPDGLITSFETFHWAIEDGEGKENMKAIYELSYEKDDAGRVTRMLRSQDGEIDEATEFYYDDEGRLARSFSTVYGDIWGPRSEIPSFKEAWWDDHGNKICELYTYHNRLSSVEIWEYDGRNLLIRESKYSIWGKRDNRPLNLREQSEHEYNWRHLVSKSTQKSGDDLDFVRTWTYEYDSEGRVAQMWSDNNYRDYASLTQYEYVVNGPERTTLETTFDEDGKLVGEVERTYEKFDAVGNLLEWEGYPNPEYRDYIYYED